MNLFPTRLLHTLTGYGYVAKRGDKPSNYDFRRQGIRWHLAIFISPSCGGFEHFVRFCFAISEYSVAGV
jgi:hypothetical protein